MAPKYNRDAEKATVLFQTIGHILRQKMVYNVEEFRRGAGTQHTRSCTHIHAPLSEFTQTLDGGVDRLGIYSVFESETHYLASV